MSTRPILASIAALLIASLAGCSSSPKLAKGTSTGGTDSFSSSAKKVQQDFAQTQTDLGKLESEAHLPK